MFLRLFYFTILFAFILMRFGVMLVFHSSYSCFVMSLGICVYLYTFSVCLEFLLLCTIFLVLEVHLINVTDRLYAIYT